MQQRDILMFPDDLRVSDDSVNKFVESAMAICGEGEYEQFRLLWSVREEPLTRDEFLEGWQAVTAIRIRAVERAILARDDEDDSESDENVYLVQADIELDPNHPAGQKNARREIALMLVRENDRWRLAKPTKDMRQWLHDLVASRSAASTPSAASVQKSSPPGGDP